MKNSKNAERKQKDRGVENKENWEARQNLVGFFSVLLKIDMRLNPHLYKKEK